MSRKQKTTSVNLQDKIVTVAVSKKGSRNGYVFIPMPIPSTVSNRHTTVSGGFEIDNPPYHINTVVFIGDPKHLTKYLKSKYGTQIDDVKVDFSTIDGLTIPCTSSNGVMFILIYLPKFDFSIQNLATLVHEIEHTATYILKFSGCHPVMFENSSDEDADDESLAYIEGEMFSKILTILSKKFLSKCNEKVKTRTKEDKEPKISN